MTYQDVKKADGSLMMVVRADSCTVLAKSSRDQAGEGKEASPDFYEEK